METDCIEQGEECMGFVIYFSNDKKEYYDSDACELHLSSGRIVEIVANSKIIFEYLVENRNKAVYREQIIRKLDGFDDSFISGRRINSRYTDRSPIDQAICKLRKEFGKYGKFISTVRGVGYKYIGPPILSLSHSMVIENESKHANEDGLAEFDFHNKERNCLSKGNNAFNNTTKEDSKDINNSCSSEVLTTSNSIQTDEEDSDLKEHFGVCFTEAKKSSIEIPPVVLQLDEVIDNFLKSYDELNVDERLRIINDRIIELEDEVSVYNPYLIKHNKKK